MLAEYIYLIFKIRIFLHVRELSFISGGLFNERQWENSEIIYCAVMQFAVIFLNSC